MSSDWKQVLTMAVFVGLLLVLVKITIPYKVKRIIRKCEFIKNNLDNRNLKKFIVFLRLNTIVNSQEVGEELRNVQKIVNEAKHIEGRLKLDLYNVLMRKRVVGIARVNPVYIDKEGNRIN